MFWQITSFPKCEYHAFLSHCREDHDQLARPVHDRLEAADVVPWLDREDYYYGRDSRSALRDGILRCRHVVFFITDAMLNTARGWCVFELAFAELVELNLRGRGGPLAHPLLPLFLVPQGDDRLPRTVWQAVRDRGLFHDPTADGDPVGWCERQVREFLSREQRLARNMAAAAAQDPPFAKRLRGVPGLFDRVTKFHPKRLPSGA